MRTRTALTGFPPEDAAAIDFKGSPDDVEAQPRLNTDTARLAGPDEFSKFGEMFGCPLGLGCCLLHDSIFP